jgi:hypothetical protein
METETTEKKVFSIAAAAKYLQDKGADSATTWTVGSLIRGGLLKTVPHLGKKHYVLKEDLDALLTRKKARA